MNHRNNPDLASPLTALGELILLSQSRALLRKVIYSKPADRAVKRRRTVFNFRDYYNPPILLCQ